MSQAPLVRHFFPDIDPGEGNFLGSLFRRETVGGAVALVSAAVALLWANSPFASSYVDLLHLQVGPLDVEHWAADGALAIFFFVAGLELKREFVVGSLRRPVDAAVPVMAAVAGVALSGGDLPRRQHPR
ncbi:MAG: Na+/H+ antiporter NhaA [Nocardioides sp.]